MSRMDLGMTTCTHCGYSWEYGGSLDMATCPECTYKTPVGDANE